MSFNNSIENFTPTFFDPDEEISFFLWKDFDKTVEYHLDYLLSVYIESIKQYTEYGTGAKSLKKIDDYTFNSIFNIIINSYSSVQKLFLLTQIKNLAFLDSNSLTDETKSIKSGLSGHFWRFYNNSSSEKNV